MYNVILRKEGGRVSVDTDLDALFATMRNGVYDITIKRKQEQRSVSQNALMWMWFGCIEEQTGTLKNDVYLYYRSKFLGKWTSLAGERPVWTSLETSKLTKEQFAEFLNHIQADAASELGITLPTPDDLHWEAFFQQYK